MGRSPCCEKEGLKKGPWTPEEDQKLLAYIQANGHGSWRALPAKAGLQRCGKSCRLRWTNYLRPDIKRGKFSLQEEQSIVQLHALLGNRWSAIATHLPKRTDNEIKNYWNTHLKKRLTKMGIDPVTHKPKHHHAFSSGSAYAKDAADLSHMAQWENARLEAETRFVRESKHLVNSTTNNNHSLSVVDVTPSNQPNNGFMCRTATSALPCLDVLKAWHGARSSKTTVGYNSISGSNIGPGMNMMNMAMDELESPTSILDISAIMYNDSKELPQITKEVDNSNVGLQEDHSYNAFTDGFDTNNVIVPAAAFSNMMDGFDNTDDVLVYTSNEQMAANIIFNNGSGVDGGCGRSGNDFEDQNRNYWNNILNLVNASPSTGSPMF